MRFEDSWVVVCVLCGMAAGAGAGEVRRLDDFETADLKWSGDFKGGIVGEHASRGRRCLKVTFASGVQYPGIEAVGVDLDWSGFEFLRMDVFNPQQNPVDLDVRIDDDKSTGYSSRYNGEFLVVNGFSTIEIALRRMSAGRRNLDPSKLVLFRIFMFSPERDATLYFDNIRLVRGEEPSDSKGSAAGRRESPEELAGLEAAARRASGRLSAIIIVAHERGFGTLEANIALVTAGLGLDVRSKLKWFQPRRKEIYKYVRSSCNDAYQALKSILDGKRVVTPVPPIYNSSRLKIVGAHLVARNPFHAPIRAEPVLLFAMLYHRSGPLCEYFTPIDFFSHTASFAGASRWDVEGTPLYRAFKEHPDTHRVWNDDEGWCGHIVRDTSSLGGGSEPVVVCLESPHTKAAIAKRIRQTADASRGKPSVLVNVLGGELSYICYCDYTLLMFRGWLAAKYVSVAALNDVWRTSHASFDEVVVMPNASQAAGNRARWFDWQSFNCHRFVEHARWVKSVIREIDSKPAVSVGSVGHSLRADFGRSGVDEENLIRHVDDVVLNEGSASTITTDLLWSLSEGRKPLFDFEYHGDVAGILPHFLHGNTAMAMWWWPDEVETRFPRFNRTALPFSWEIPLEDVAECLKIALDVRRLSPQIAAFPREPAQVAILYSRASMLQAEPDFLSFTDTPHTMELKNAHEASLCLDTPVRFISTRQIREGKLAGYRVLVVPAARYVFDEVAERILEFAAGGGVVVVTPESLTHDEYARPRDHLGRLGLTITARREPRFTAGRTSRHEFLQEFLTRAKADRLPKTEIRVEPCKLFPSGASLDGVGVFQQIETSDNVRVLGYNDGGEKALFEIPHGEGFIYYLATPLAPESLNLLLDAVARSAGVERPVRFSATPSELDWRLEGRSVETERSVLFYLTNHSEEAIRASVELPFEPQRVIDLRDAYREVELDAIGIPPGRTRIFAAVKGGRKK